MKKKYKTTNHKTKPQKW